MKKDRRVGDNQNPMRKNKKKEPKNPSPRLPRTAVNSLLKASDFLLRARTAAVAFHRSLDDSKLHEGEDDLKLKAELLVLKEIAVGFVKAVDDEGRRKTIEEMKAAANLSRQHSIVSSTYLSAPAQRR